MRLAFVTVRAIVVAGGFFWLWAWVAGMLLKFDDSLGGALPEWSGFLSLFALPLGGTLAGWCFGVFIVRGRGTPAPFDPPRRLVVAGPYRYIRNPMSIGAALVLLGAGLALRSPSIVLFVPVWLLLFHLIVISYEETVLRGKFGRDYDEYCRRTPRWIPRLQ